MSGQLTLPDPYLGPSVRTWPAIWREAWDERAAILEYDAGMTRADAEDRAEAMVRAEYERLYGQGDR